MLLSISWIKIGTNRSECRNSCKAIQKSLPMILFGRFCACFKQYAKSNIRNQ